MSGDYSRLTFDVRKDYSGVQLQQGRPLTDADWNEQGAAIARRIQAGMLDTVGRAVVPRALPEGFRITLDAGQLTIGRGRMYVDGLLVENHGVAPTAWDTQLAESFGSAPTPFAKQPYAPVATALPTAGTWIAYLDVWQREVSPLQDRALPEKALGGVDTTTRVQTVWQVKLHQAGATRTDGRSVNCANALQNDAAWGQLVAAPSSRLSSTTAAVPGEPDPCLIPPGAGYKGLENQLYRVEIHQGGTAALASFKWSRDNASVETRVARIVDATHVIVDSIGKDEVLKFSDGDWIEFVDETRELSGQAGELRRIRVGGGVDAATRRITLDKALPATAEFAAGVPDAARALRIRRWDQKGKVRRADGTLHADLDTASANGAIPIPAAGTQLLLENGVVVSFAAQPVGGRYRVGEWWAFAARAADASIEALKDAPPRGPHHHYAKLAVIAFPNAVEDCRVLWPPQATQGEGCACTVCVTPAAHADGSMTVQMAIAEVQRRGGGTVCLEIGEYLLPARLEISGARSLRLRGQGRGTVLRAPVEALRILDSRDVRVEDLSLRAQEPAPAPVPAAPPAPAAQPTVGLSPAATEPTTVRPFRLNADAQRMHNFATLSSASLAELRRASREDRANAAAANASAAAANTLPSALITVQQSPGVVLSGLWMQSGRAAAVGDTTRANVIVIDGISGVAVMLLDATPELRIEHCNIVAPIGVLMMKSNQFDATQPARIAPDTDPADVAVRVQSNRIESGFACLLTVADIVVSRLLIGENVLRSPRFGLFLGSSRGTQIHLSRNDVRARICAMIGSCALLEIGDNLLLGDERSSAMGGVVLTGQSRAWGVVDIHDNLVGNIGGIAFIVAGTARGMRLHLSGNRLNDVGRGLVFAGFVASVPGRGQAEAGVPAEVAESVRVEHNDFRGVGGSGAAPDGDIPEPCALALRAINLRVAGNLFEGSSGEPLVGVHADGLCEFSSNRGERARDERLNRFADVHLRAGTAIAASNHLLGSLDLALAIEPLTEQRERSRCTVLGNMTRGDIRVLGPPTPAALDQFNIIDPSL